MSSVYALGNVAQSELNEIRVNKLIMNDMEAYACRAWVNFDGNLDEGGGSLSTGENVLIRESGNISSVTYNGTGDYTVNFTTAMPNTNYTFLGTSNYGLPNSNQNVSAPYQAAPTTSGIRMVCSNGSPLDQLYVYAAVFC